MLTKAIVAVGLVVALTSLAAASPSGAAGEVTRVSGNSPFQPGGSHHCSLDDQYRDLESESSIAVDPTDGTRIAVAWPQDNSLGVVVASTHDGGQTWTRSIVDGFTTCTRSSKEMNRVSHPRLSFAPDGILYLAAFPVGEWEPHPRNIENDIMIARSEDAGSTWSHPTSITAGSLNDFDGMTVEPDTGAVDVIWAENEGRDSATIGEPIYLSRSTDQGQTWNKSFVRRATPGSVAFTKASPLPGGELVVFSQDVPIPSFGSRAGPHGPIWVLTSDTKGKKWSAPVKLVEDAVNGWPSVAVTKKGSLFLAYRTRSSGGDDLPVAGAAPAFTVWLIRSDDAGKTWTDPVEAFTYPYCHGIYPFITIAAAGEQTVGVLHYTDGETPCPEADTPSHQARVAVSADCGQTWTSMPLGRRFTLTGDLRAVDAMGFAQGIAPTPNGFLVSASLGGEDHTLGPTDMFVAPVEWEGIRNSSCAKRG